MSSLHASAPGHLFAFAYQPHRVSRQWHVASGRSSECLYLTAHAGISDEVKDQPVGVEMLGEKLVLFRDSQAQVHCLSDICPHRGAPLHKGWVDTVQGHDCVVRRLLLLAHTYCALPYMVSVLLLLAHTCPQQCNRPAITTKLSHMPPEC